MKTAGSCNPVEAYPNSSIRNTSPKEGLLSACVGEWVSECLLHSYLEPGTTLPLIPPDFQIGICKKNKRKTITQISRALDPLQTPWRIPCTGSSWLEYPSLWFNKVRLILSGDLNIIRKVFIWKENHWLWAEIVVRAHNRWRQVKLCGVLCGFKLLRWA